MIELHDFMTPSLIERAHARSIQIRDHHQRGTVQQRAVAASLRQRGIAAAQDRHPKMLLFLEKSVEHMRKLNDEQGSRFAQAGFARVKFTEFATWEAAFIKSDQLGKDESIQHGVFAWVYASIFDAALT